MLGGSSGRRDIQKQKRLDVSPFPPSTAMAAILPILRPSTLALSFTKSKPSAFTLPPGQAGLLLRQMRVFRQYAYSNSRVKTANVTDSGNAGTMAGGVLFPTEISDRIPLWMPQK